MSWKNGSPYDTGTVCTTHNNGMSQQGERNQPQTLQTMKEEIAEKSSSTEEDAVHSLCDKDDLYTPIPELRPRPCDRKMKKPIHEPR